MNQRLKILFYWGKKFAEEWKLCMCLVRYSLLLSLSLSLFLSGWGSALDPIQIHIADSLARVPHAETESQ